MEGSYSFMNLLLVPWHLYLSFRKAKIITVEPVLFLYMLGRFLYFPLIQQYFFWRYGMDKLQNTSYPFPNSSFCITKKELNHYGGNGTSDSVEQSANYLILYGQVANTLPSVVAALAFGPLSDRFGRKPIIIVISCGAVTQGLGVIGIIHFRLNEYYFLLTNAISGITGGFTSILTLCFSYIADVSTLKQRTWRIGVVESMIFLGGGIGQWSGGYWLQEQNCSFEQPMWLYMAVNCLIIGYILLLLPESKNKAERSEHAKNRPSGFAVLIEGFRIFFGRVREYSVWRLWTALLCINIYMLNKAGTALITTFFLLTDPLDWGPETIGIYGLVSQMSHGVSLVLILPIFVFIGLSDALIVLIGLAVACSMSVFTGFVKVTWEMLLVGAIQGIEAVIPSTARGIGSKLIKSKDQGVLFSIIASTEVLSVLGASAVYNTVYPLTLKHGLKSGTAYFLMAVLFLVPVPLVLLLLAFQKRKSAQPPDQSNKVQPLTSSTDERQSLLGSTKYDSESDEQLSGTING